MAALLKTRQINKKLKYSDMIAQQQAQAAKAPGCGNSGAPSRLRHPQV
jgi:hypothetical protein